jgi:hypothetical protein
MAELHRQKVTDLAAALEQAFGPRPLKRSARPSHVGGFA